MKKKTSSFNKGGRMCVHAVWCVRVEWWSATRSLCLLFHLAPFFFFNSFSYVQCRLVKILKSPLTACSPVPKHTYTTQMNKKRALGFSLLDTEYTVGLQMATKMALHFSIIGSMSFFGFSETEWDGNYRDNQKN